MRWLLPALPGLACAGMMLLVCLPMLMNRRHGSDEGVSKEDVAALREEVARLKAERTVSGSKDEYV